LNSIPVRWCFALAGIAGLCALPACATYAPAPLVPEDELAHLRATQLPSLRIERAAPGAAEEARDLGFNPADGLDEAELVAVALTLNPELRAQRLQLGEARALLVSAGLWPDPVLGFSVRPGIDGASSVGYGGELLFTLLAPDEQPARVALGEAQVEVALAELTAAEWRLVGDVRRARLAVLASDQVVRMLQQEADLAAEVLALVHHQKVLGETSDLAVALVELEQAGATRRLRDGLAAADDAARALGELAGLPPGAALPLTESGRQLTFTLVDDPDDDELDRRVLAGNPVLRVRAAAYEAAEQELRLAVARQWPRLGVGPAYEHDVEGAESFGLGVDLSLPLWDRNQGEIAGRTAARDRSRAEYAAALHAARAHAFATRAELRRARAEVELQENEVAPLVARTEALFEGALRAGELSSVEWLTARGRSVEARRGLVDALLRYARAATELDAVTGMAPGRAAAAARGAAADRHETPGEPDTSGSPDSKGDPDHE